MVQSGATPAKSHPQQQNVQKYNVIDRDQPFFFFWVAEDGEHV